MSAADDAERLVLAIKWSGRFEYLGGDKKFSIGRSRMTAVSTKSQEIL
jgi:hypothetical protein